MHEKLKWTLICVLISNPNIELLLSDLHCTVEKFGNTSLRTPKAMFLYLTAGLLSGIHPDAAGSRVFSLDRHVWIVWLCLLKVEGVWCYDRTLCGTWMIFW